MTKSVEEYSHIKGSTFYQGREAGKHGGARDSGLFNLVRLLGSVGALSLTACASSPSLIAPRFEEPIIFNDNLETGLTRYAALGSPKAFAASPNGHYGHAGPEGNITVAIAGALQACQYYARQACRIYRVNGLDFEQRYADYYASSVNAIKGMVLPAPGNYRDEATDYGTPAPTDLVSSGGGFGGPTPLHLPGIETIDTATMAKRLVDGKTVVIDARNWSGYETRTIPGAYSIDRAGTLESRQKSYWKAFVQIMQEIAPDKSQAVMVFCGSSQCWSSPNAALNLQLMGYTKILWYRGGMDAWVAAGLPTVTMVPYATVIGFGN